MLHRRETMIALRPRRQSIEIASKVAHPVARPLQALAVDAPPDERVPWIEPPALATIKTLRSAGMIILASVGAFLLIYYRLFWPY